MKIKRVLFSLLILSLVFSAVKISVAAEDDFQFKTSITTENTEFKAGETFEVKVAITDITNEKGFIGVNLYINYDPEYLSVVYTVSEQENSDSEYSDVVFGEINLPEKWTTNGEPEKTQNVILDENGSETGTAVILCVADLLPDKLLDIGFTEDEFYVTIPFKCVAACDTTSISIKTDGNLACTQIEKVDDNYFTYDCLGQGSELVINNIQAAENQSGETPEEQSGDGNLLYILLAAGAVIIVAAVVAVILFKKKK